MEAQALELKKKRTLNSPFLDLVLISQHFHESSLHWGAFQLLDWVQG